MPPLFYYIFIFLFFLFIIAATLASWMAYSMIHSKFNKSKELAEADSYIWYSTILLIIISILIFIGILIYLFVNKNGYYSKSFKIFTGIISFLIITLMIIAGTFSVVTNVKLTASDDFNDNNVEDQKIRFNINLTIALCYGVSVLLFMFFMTYAVSVECPVIIQA